MRTATTTAVAMLRYLFMGWVSLETVAEIHAPEKRVGLVQAFEPFRVLAIGIAVLEVQHQEGRVDDERTGVPAGADRRADAVGVRQQRADRLDRLRVLVVHGAEADV